MKRTYIFAAAALALAACDNNDDNPVDSPVAARISATIGESVPTRVSDHAWDPGDVIGISVSMGDKRPHVNVAYTTADGNGNFKGNPVYFYKPMTVTAYYPFTGEEGTDPGVVEATTGIDNQTDATRPNIDFLWDQKTEYSVVNNKPEIHFNFSHKMSKLTLVFKNGTGMDVGDIVSYTIEGLVLDGTFDTATGECAVKDEATAAALSVDLAEPAVSGKSLSPLIVFPQAIGGDGVKLHVYTRESGEDSPLQHYLCKLSFGGGKIEAGHNYLYTVTVNKAALEVKNQSIIEWIVTTNKDDEDIAQSTD